MPSGKRCLINTGCVRSVVSKWKEKPACVKQVVWSFPGKGAVHLQHPVSRGQSEWRSFQFPLRQAFTVSFLC